MLKKSPSLNVYGEVIEPCSFSPLTGFFRDGCCNTSSSDIGQHIVCAIMTDNFLNLVLFCLLQSVCLFQVPVPGPIKVPGYVVYVVVFNRWTAIGT